MNIQNEHGIEEGRPGSLLILHAKNGFDAVRRQVPVRYSIRNGKVIAETQPATTHIYLNEKEQVTFKR